MAANIESNNAEKIEQKMFDESCKYLAGIDWAEVVTGDDSVHEKLSAMFESAWTRIQKFAGEHDAALPKDEGYSPALLALREKYNIGEFEKELAALELQFRTTVVPVDVETAFERYCKFAKGFGLRTINPKGGFREKSTRGR